MTSKQYSSPPQPTDNTLDYFAPLLPWQQAIWSQLTARAIGQQSSLPHAMLAAGIEGVGKRRFVWRLVAWLLCRAREIHPDGACGACESCEWLKSGTHPNLQVLPAHDLLVSDEATESHKDSKVKSEATKNTIKIDDIRQLISFVQQGSQGLRVCVFDHAEQMTIAAANALLKTLEEPHPLVHLILITDAPAQLLPTIKSRVQQLPLQTIPTELASAYISEQLDIAPSDPEVEQLLALANGAPLAAVTMAQAPWYDKRQLWLTTWLALRAGKRSALAASDYWQKQLSLTDFTQLTELMIIDISRVALGLDSLQTDCNIAESLPEAYRPSSLALNSFADEIANTKRAIQQNVQEKLAYDKLMQSLSSL